jgi:hypothetical protein
VDKTFLKNMRTTFALLVVPLVLAATVGCGFMKDVGLAPNEGDPASIVRAATPDEPAHVVVQVILISFDGAKVLGATRSKDEAQRLAERLLEDARGGRDFAELVRLYSDGRAEETTVALANWGVSPATEDEFERQRKPRSLGAVAFALPVGQVGLAPQNDFANPDGWRVIKRIK